MRALVGALVALVLATPAAAASTLEVSTVQPPQAGARVDLQIEQTFDSTPASTTLHLPTGLVVHDTPDGFGVSMRPDYGFDVQPVGPLPPSLSYSLDVTLPTSCQPKTPWAETDGVVTYAQEPLQPLRCEDLPFAPQVALTVEARERPAVTVAITQADGEAATRALRVALPAGLAHDATACPAPCTVTAVATARAVAGVVRLAGTLTQDVTGTRVVVAFDALPELALTELTLTLAGPLRATQDLCRSGLGSVAGTFAAFSGATASHSAATALSGADYYCIPDPPYPCVAATPRHELTVKGLRRGRPRLKVGLRRGSRCPRSDLRRARVRLPRGLRFVGRAIVVRANGKKVRSFTVRRRALVISTKARNLVIETKAGAIRAKRRARGRALRFVTRVSVQGGRTYVLRKRVARRGEAQ